MSTALRAPGFPEREVRERARHGAACAFPPRQEYGHSVYGAGVASGGDAIDGLRLAPPVFMPGRLEKLIDLGREPQPGDVRLACSIGGFSAPLPLYVSALGSTQVSVGGLAEALSRQAGRLGLPMVIGENVVPSHGYGRLDTNVGGSLRARIGAYCAELPDGSGGVVVQQSTEDADAEVWNALYSDPAASPLLDSDRLAFEIKVGQGAKPGLGGMSLTTRDGADRQSFATVPLFEDAADQVLRCASAGTFTEEILRQQIRLVRNNYPRVRVWVKLPPGRDVGLAAATAWAAGADAVTVDGAESGSGWAPTAFLDHVGLPLAECLRRVVPGASCLLASGRMWEGSRVVKAMALGARAVGLGRAALLAVDEDPECGMERLANCLALEIGLLTSALGKYRTAELGPEDLWPMHEPYPPEPLPASAATHAVAPNTTA
ncbi:glutamate synthase-related protein [Streptomyces sp. NPDC093250]|uniref:glutamate synthase-related protein n=1 Tax=Streptomyces sp. NPDC093250 TaxID=3366036 RepID=UPI00380CD8EB